MKPDTGRVVNTLPPEGAIHHQQGRTGTGHSRYRLLLVVFGVLCISLVIATATLLAKPVYPATSDGNSVSTDPLVVELPCGRVIQLIINDGITPEDVLSGGEKLPSDVDLGKLRSCNQQYPVLEKWSYVTGSLSLVAAAAGGLVVVKRRRHGPVNEQATSMP